MPVYESPEGVLYNLDKFASYEVKTDGYQRSGEESPRWQLLAKTETDREVIIHSGNHREAEIECKKELDKIYQALSHRISISVILDAETRKSLCDIRSELETLRRQIGKEN